MKANYSGALELARSSQSAIDGILKKYPDSSIALRLMSDPNVMVASCPYRDLKTKLIPRLELMADPLMKPVSIAWALAVGKSHTGCSGRIAAFALELAKYRQELGISPEEFQKMEALCVYKIPDYTQKSALISSLEGIKAPAPAPASAKQEQPNLKATLVLAPAAAKINNTEDFLASSRSDASLVSYELRAVDSLKKKAPIAGASGGEVQKAFLKILEEARGNILKISTESMRESALSNIAVAFADAGDVVEAVRIAQSLKNHELFESVFNAIADRAGSGKNYISAMGLAERLKNQKAKDEFLSRMAAGLAKQGLFRESIEISKRIKSVYSRNEALAVAAKCAMAKGKNDIVLSAVSLIDIGDLSFLKTFDSSLPAGFKENSQTLKAYRLASFADKLIPYSAKLAEAVNNLAISACSDSKENFSEISRIVVSNLIRLNSTKEALKFIMANMPRIRPELFVPQICSAAIEVSKSDMAMAEKYFSIASDISNNSVEIAFAMLRAHIPFEKQVEILGRHMPAMLPK